MFGIEILIQKIALLLIMIIIGLIIRKYNIVDDSAAGLLANITVYVTQPAMIIYSFIDAKFTKEILFGCIVVFIIALLSHILYYVIALKLFKNVPYIHQKTLRYGMVFTNAGFLGIPLIGSLIGSVGAVYSTFYVLVFNIFNWSVGCYIYTKDKKYMSPKKMFWNPATVPTYIGIILAILIGTVRLPEAIAPVFTNYLVPIFYENVLYLLKCAVLPISMIMIGVRLVGCNFLKFFKDKNILLLFFIRLIALPFFLLLVMKLLSITGIFSIEQAKMLTSVIVISAATPVAAMASIFAEKFEGDPTYSGAIVSISSVLSLVTMALVSSVMLGVI